MAAREAVGKGQMGRGAATLGQKPPLEVSQVQVGCTLSRGVSTEVVAASFLQSRTYLIYQNPVSSKAHICCSSSKLIHSDLYSLPGHKLLLNYDIKKFRAEIKALLLYVQGFTDREFKVTENR